MQAYKAFEERELPRLKDEYPGLRLGQLKQKLFKLWKKSPDNPMNQENVVSYNVRKQDVVAAAGATASSGGAAGGTA